MSSLPGVSEAGGSFKRHRREVVYQGKIVRVLRDGITLPNGVDTDYEVLEYPCAVSIIPVLETEAGGQELVMVEQFRNAVGGVIHEIPAGMLEPDEDPLSCARRELKEETGYTAERWTHVTTLFPTPGISGVTMVYFLAEGLNGGAQSLEETECLEVRRVPVDGLVDAMVRGRNVDGVPRIVDGKTHMAVYYLAACLGCAADGEAGAR